MDKISYDSSNDLLIHVGDLIAKGDKNEEVLQWMNDHAIMGVRGNHDQPVRHVLIGLEVNLTSGYSVAHMDGVGWRGQLGKLHRQLGFGRRNWRSQGAQPREEDVS